MAWEQQTKSILTREGIKKDLLGEMRANLIAICALVGGFSLVGLLVTFIGFQSVAGRLICVAVWLSLVMYLVYAYASTYIAVAKNQFSVVEDELVRTAEEIRRRGKAYRLELAFYFAEHGRYVVTEVDGSPDIYSGLGDRFYLVIYDYNNSKKKAKATPVRIYNTRIYEWKE